MYRHLPRGIGPHTHIERGEDGYVHGSSSHVQIDLLKRLEDAENGTIVSLVGNTSSGKSALLTEFLKDGKSKLVYTSAYELEDASYKKTRKTMRSTALVSFKEQLKVVEGEIISINNDKLVLKTVDMESAFDIGAKMKAELERERASVGDIIKIYKEAGFVTRIGRSAMQKSEIQNSLFKSVEIPEGECFKTENVHTELSLDEIDVINYKEAGEELIYSNIYVSDSVQHEVDNKVAKWIKERKATIRKGIVIIEDSHLLSKNVLDMIYSYKSRLYCPLIILVGKIIDEDIKKRSIIIKIDDVNNENIGKILKSRARFLGVSVEDKSIETLTIASLDHGLPYGFYLMQATSDNPITVSALKKVSDMFLPTTVRTTEEN